MGLIFYEPFLNNLNFFDTVVPNAGKFVWTASGPNSKPGISMAPTDTNPLYGFEAHTALTTQTDARFGGYLNLNTLAIPASGNVGVFLWRTSVPVERLKLRLYNNAGVISFIHDLRGDDGVVTQGIISLAGATNLRWELWVSKTNGESKLYWDTGSGGLLLKDTRSKTLTTTFGAQTEIYYGAPSAPTSGLTGAVLFGPFGFRDDSTAIGAYSYSTAPTVTDIVAQSASFGTQKSIACTIADADSNIVRCDISTNGPCLITLTASGAAVVTGNGTTAAYVTGTHADVVATLAGNIKLDRAYTAALWPEKTAAETVTVLVVDALGATGTDTFLVTWTILSGQNKKRVVITGTATQVLAAIKKVTITPQAGYLGTIRMRMITVGGALQDDDQLTLVVQNVAGGSGRGVGAGILTGVLRGVI